MSHVLQHHCSGTGEHWANRLILLAQRTVLGIFWTYQARSEVGDCTLPLCICCDCYATPNHSQHVGICWSRYPSSRQHTKRKTAPKIGTLRSLEKGSSCWSGRCHLLSFLGCGRSMVQTCNFLPQNHILPKPLGSEAHRIFHCCLGGVSFPECSCLFQKNAGRSSLM